MDIIDLNLNTHLTEWMYMRNIWSNAPTCKFLHNTMISLFRWSRLHRGQYLTRTMLAQSTSVCNMFILKWRLEMYHGWRKLLVRYILPSVCLRLRQFSQSSFIQYMGLCVFILPNSPVVIVRMCSLSYYHQTGSMNHKPLFRVRSCNNGMRCMSYYVLIIDVFRRRGWWPNAMK